RDALQDLDRDLRDQLPDPGLPRRRAGHRVGPVRRGHADRRRRRPRHVRRARVHRALLRLLPADAVVHAHRPDPARADTGDDVMPTTYARLSRGLVALAAAAALFAAVEAAASSGPDLRFEPAPVHRLDDASLQRGARTFVNYCLN